MSLYVSLLIGIIIAAISYAMASIYYPMLAGGAAYDPTPRKIAAQALNLADLKRDDVFYDLGCGTGDVLTEASKLCDHVNGIEIEPVRWFIASLRARKAHVILGNFFKQDISDADVVFLFQYQGRINNRIMTKIKAETQQGTRIVSYYHPIEDIKLVKRQNKLFVYKT